MDKEKEYAELVGAKHLKELGQFFTGGRQMLMFVAQKSGK